MKSSILTFLCSRWESPHSGQVSELPGIISAQRGHFTSILLSAVHFFTLAINSSWLRWIHSDRQYLHCKASSFMFFQHFQQVFIPAGQSLFTLSIASSTEFACTVFSIWNRIIFFFDQFLLESNTKITRNHRYFLSKSCSATIDPVGSLNGFLEKWNLASFCRVIRFVENEQKAWEQDPSIGQTPLTPFTKNKSGIFISLYERLIGDVYCFHIYVSQLLHSSHKILQFRWSSYRPSLTLLCSIVVLSFPCYCKHTLIPILIELQQNMVVLWVKKKTHSLLFRGSSRVWVLFLQIAYRLLSSSNRQDRIIISYL